MKPETAQSAELIEEHLQKLSAWLVQAWVNGEDPGLIRSALQEKNWLREKSASSVEAVVSAHENDFLTADLDGDGADEWILTLQTRGSGCTSGGELWIVNDSGVIYELHPAGSGSFWGAPVTVFLTDMTGDGLPELVSKAIGCGAHTDLGMYHVLSSHHGKVENIVDPDNDLDRAVEYLRTHDFSTTEEWDETGISFPTPAEYLDDYNGDGLQDLHLRGGKFGSVGAGDVRQRTEIWAWDGRTITLIDVQPESTDVRIHTLYDANLAFARCDYDKASTLYQRAIHDDSLATNGLFYSDRRDRPIVQVFSAFRLALISLTNGDLEGAEFWADWLVENHPDEYISDAADLLLESWSLTGDLQESCGSVTEYLRGIEEQEDILSVTGALCDTGYAIKCLRAADVCPIIKE
jgi:hypothetical protein